MTRHRWMGSEALALLKTHLSRRALLRGSATGAAGLGLAALTGQTTPAPARAAQDVCGGEAVAITLAAPNDRMREILAISRYDKLFAIVDAVGPDV